MCVHVSVSVHSMCEVCAHVIGVYVSVKVCEREGM